MSALSSKLTAVLLWILACTKPPSCPTGQWAATLPPPFQSFQAPSDGVLTCTDSVGETWLVHSTEDGDREQVEALYAALPRATDEHSWEPEPSDTVHIRWDGHLVRVAFDVFEGRVGAHLTDISDTAYPADLDEVLAGARAAMEPLERIATEKPWVPRCGFSLPESVLYTDADHRAKLSQTGSRRQLHTLYPAAKQALEVQAYAVPTRDFYRAPVPRRYGFVMGIQEAAALLVQDGEPVCAVRFRAESTAELDLPEGEDHQAFLDADLEANVQTAQAGALRAGLGDRLIYPDE